MFNIFKSYNNSSFILGHIAKDKSYTLLPQKHLGLMSDCNRKENLCAIMNGMFAETSTYLPINMSYTLVFKVFCNNSTKLGA